jgi:hypothetical protein
MTINIADIQGLDRCIVLYVAPFQGFICARDVVGTSTEQRRHCQRDYGLFMRFPPCWLADGARA